MKWIIIAVIFGFLYYLIFVKAGNMKFWRVANANPEKAYSFFESNNYFVVFKNKPDNGYRKNLPLGKWDGPFKLSVPSIGKTVTIYGNVPHYEDEQNKFLKSIQ